MRSEALVRGRIPFTILGDIGFYNRQEIRNSFALLRLLVSPDDRQSDESFRRSINIPTRGFAAKTLGLLEEAAWRRVSLRQALETAHLPPMARKGRPRGGWITCRRSSSFPFIPRMPGYAPRFWRFQAMMAAALAPPMATPGAQQVTATVTADVVLMRPTGLPASNH